MWKFLKLFVLWGAVRADHPETCYYEFQDTPLFDVDRSSRNIQICCANSRYAEPSGYFKTKGLFRKLTPENTTIFYDSTCGLPLFEAPIGRTFDSWEKESIAHGWPSFRDEEVIWENVLLEEDGTGETVSVCGTHLGHNIPDYSGNRYCINLACISGSENTELTTEDVIEYKKSHDPQPIDLPSTNIRLAIGIIAGFCCILLCMFAYALLKSNRGKNEGGWCKPGSPLEWLFLDEVDSQYEGSEAGGMTRSDFTSRSGAPSAPSLPHASEFTVTIPGATDMPAEEAQRVYFPRPRGIVDLGSNSSKEEEYQKLSADEMESPQKAEIFWETTAFYTTPKLPYYT